ncbi:NAD(P)/FAD-dependent oxidoreductase [Arthrobacter dokdonensis]|uniref:NAD(P)/FAD-dependent oxidoreductase n=1 Tax=Arthrobacter dokdonellae TaxID=2211210 RepID=UPI0014947EC6|nr:FAD-binding oxidoreductase [Arthrobacter dokdonellae]
MKIAVIGAGMIGVSIAAEAAARGAEVTLIDKGFPGSGTSSLSYGWVNSNNKDPQDYFELNRAGMDAHYRLAADGADWFAPTGHVEFATDAEHATELLGRLDRLAELGYAAEKIAPGYARELVPDLVVPAGCEIVAIFPREAHCYPNLYIRARLAEARLHRLRVLAGVGVERLAGTASGAQVVLSDGSTILVDHVVSAAGRWTNSITAAAGLGPVMTDYREPGDVTVGYLAVTNPLSADITRLVTSPELNVRPAGGGRLMLQALDLDATAEPDSTPDAKSPLAAEFTRRLQAMLRNTGNASISELGVGRRAMPADGRSVIGTVAGEPWLYLVATHSGVTLAPLLGAGVVAEIHGEPEPLFDGFRPSRLLEGEHPASLPAPRRPGEQ